MAREVFLHEFVNFLQLGSIAADANAATEFPDDPCFLLDPNAWIGDTAATANASGHKEGFTNISQCDGETVAGFNGQGSKTSFTGDIPGVVCDKSGAELHEDTMTNVSYNADTQYNLYSVSKKLKEGWKLESDDDSITLRKNGMEIKTSLKRWKISSKNPPK